MDTSHNHHFDYTSGRWPINEAHQLKTRYISFNVPALQRIAGQLLESPMTFSLQMENGREILARVPNPNTGHAHYVVASEVATLDFLRTVLQIPVPRVLSWSSFLQVNPVGAEYILMERVQGQRLSDVWDEMSEAQHFRLIKSLVEIGRKLVNAKFTLHGSLYYRDTFLQGRTIANREISRIRNVHDRSSDVTVPGRKALQRRDDHIQFLEQISNVFTPVLLHSDLHHHNIFGDMSDPKISSITDWQTVHTAPLFIPAKFPSIFDCGDTYLWGAVQPRLPKDFKTLLPAVKKQAEDQLDRLRVKKFYKLASRKFNPALVDAMDKMRDNSDPTTFIFHIIGRSSEDGLLPLKKLLIQVFEKWDRIMERRGSTQACPISFSRTEIEESRQQVEAWAAAFEEFESLRADLLGDDGWVSHDDYEEAMSRWAKNKATLESLRERLETLI
ncbi:hypothetical protein BO82DRAFT_382665 [Aspergillus uvarum CBS 121591]|uniref:Aminoglycoside phosphotransferase domain-containing protein n=1 Tax=Aspergillus uvarum CBS 121591 TaxID=1448315 RepID=A0A319D565_9EURO|nr:hypothetical protein BO82DRAFT_382665 [Aspergillus uvarum CBS 121591]PYH83028.1 hypothetical protein BO82DRAFT_382665 [Aspergillus uvarum CBS 121591]